MTTTDKLLEEKKFDASGFINTKLAELFTLKQYKYPTYFTVSNEYKQIELFGKDDDTANYKSNVGFALVSQKKAEILSATPQYDFLPQDGLSQKGVGVFKRVWAHVWRTSHTDAEVSKIVDDALKYGAGFGIEEACEIKRTVKVPKKVGDKIVWEEKEITDYEGCKLSHIPWNDVFLNGRTMEESDEAIRIRHYPRKKAFELFRKPMFDYDETKIPEGRYYYVAPSGSLYVDGKVVAGDTSIGNAPQYKDWVSVLEYWNKSNDSYVVMMNNVWINEKEGGGVMPLPYPHKEIPLVCYTDHYVDDSVYALGEYEITGRSRYLKDEARSQIIEVSSAQQGIITIAPDSDFDESLAKFGPRQMARVARDDVNFFAPSINASTLQYIEQKADEDIIVESGVDFRSQLLSPNETAEKTKGRTQAAQKRLSSHIKYNAFTFWERLARLRLANLMDWYGDEGITISLYGETQAASGSTVMEPLNGGYGLFTVTPEMMGGKFKVVPVIDSLYGDTTNEMKNKWLEFTQLVMNMVDPQTGKPVADPKNLIEAWRANFDDVIDIDKVLAKKPEAKTPDSILDEIDASDKGLPTDGEVEPGYVPPSQRSGRPVLIGSSPNS